MTQLECTSGEIAISDMIVAINRKIEALDYATQALGGTVKVKLDETNANDIKLYITTDGTEPGV